MPLRVVIGLEALAGAGGTESYALTVARELQRLGHDPVLSAAERGPLAERAAREGFTVAGRGPDLPPACDAVLANDAIAATELAARYPQARVVHVAHSDLHDHQLPPLTAGIVDAVVVMSDRIAARVRALALPAPVVRLQQPVDTEHFFPGGPPAPRPRRAVILSNYLGDARRAALEAAWGPAGVQVVQVGVPVAAALDAAPEIRDADIVVGKARAILEGMACGRAAYVFDAFGGDGWVTPERYAALEADNFAGHATPLPTTPEDLRRALEAYDPDMGWVNRELAITHHGARRHAVALVDVLRPDGTGSGTGGADALEELARLERLRWRTQRQVLALESELSALRTRTVAAEDALEGQRLRADAIEAEARRAHAAAAAAITAADADAAELQASRAALAVRRTSLVARLRGRR